MHKHSHHSGFSLVELSIVLVILGLLTGGILAGQSLIRAAELRSVTTSFRNYSQALYAFRDKYFAVPGDMNAATKFWGTAAGTGSDAACHNVYKTSTATCNGNGDGNVYGSGLATPHTNVERFLVWQHLANAGMVEGSYTGRTEGIVDYGPVAGRNLPSGRIGSTYFDIFILSSVSFADTFPDMTPIFANFISLYGPPGSNYSALRPEEMWNLDTKLDDGRPGSGLVIHYKATSSVAPGCVTTDSAATAQYALTSSAISCSPFMRLLQ